MSENQSQSVYDAVKDINEDVFLPGIQRDLVWKEDKIRKLFDSVIEDYPFGEVVYWTVADVSKSQIIYEFIQHKVDSYPVENKLKEDVQSRFYVKKDKLQYRNQQVDKDTMEELARSDKTRNLVIDGQQRLSAFFIGLRGSYSKKRGDGTWQAARQLYIEISDSKSEDRPNHLRNNIRFKDEGGDNMVVTSNSVWLRLGVLYDIREEYGSDAMEKLFSLARNELEEQDREGALGKVMDEVNRLWNKLITDDSKVNTFTLEDRTAEDIIEAFVRINTSGEKLKKSDLFLSILTNSWADAGLNAKEEINRFVENIKDEGYSGGFSFNVKKTLDALAMCLGDMGTGYEISDFSKGNRINRAKELWDYHEENGETVSDGQVQSAVFKTLEFLSERGFDAQAMTNQSHALMPVIYYFFKNPNVDLGWKTPTGPNGTPVGDKIEYFVSVALLDSVYSRRFEQIDVNIKKGINKSENEDFSLSAIYEEVEGATNFNLKPRPIEVRNSLTGSVFTQGGAYGLLRLMYFPFREHTTGYERDHILCKERFTEANLQSKGFEDWEADNLVDDWRNSPSNIQLLPQSLHSAKGEMTPKAWFEKIQNSDSDFFSGHHPPSELPMDYFKTHYIPDPEKAGEYKVRNIKEFLDQRNNRISQHLQGRFNSTFLEAR